MTDTRQPCQYCDLMLDKEDLPEHYQSEHMRSVLVRALQEIRDNLWRENDAHRANGDIDLANPAWWRARDHRRHPDRVQL